MTVTINVNNLSLCHKASGGVIKNTLPDFCKTPDKCIPLPYQIVSFSRDLVKGTTRVEADGGNMCAVLGSEFSKCTGDEAGSCGGIISGTNLKEATWITYSPDVFMEGKPVCRLTDKMWMNHGNTVALAGLVQPPVVSSENLVGYLCGIICDCADAIKPQICMDKAIEEDYYKKDPINGRLYPKDFNNSVLREVSMEQNSDGKWGIITNTSGTSDHPPGTTQTTNPITPFGGIRPDVIFRNGGKTERIIEVKFGKDTPNANQNPFDEYSKYNVAARDPGARYQVLREQECPCKEEKNEPEAAPIPAREKEGFSVGTYVAMGVIGIGVVAACVFGGCEAALAGGIIAAASAAN